ncbi:hypothetical protein FB567DRAFT_2404 [Paraphoma chrysanthemicola]|uniref:Secreted protein n=1 Tax=Paraphoma chrysanthemicola TaxID=798071 RepID=A0A8K0RIJ3_9PLEO|nr:hypothetical protein FB567DRAFT_2404 [Paraphoma chrysanthemicola]
MHQHACLFLAPLICVYGHRRGVPRSHEPNVACHYRHAHMVVAGTPFLRGATSGRLEVIAPARSPAPWPCSCGQGSVRRLTCLPSLCVVISGHTRRLGFLGIPLPGATRSRTALDARSTRDTRLLPCRASLLRHRAGLRLVW